MPVASAPAPDGTLHYFMRDEFTMQLDPRDDQPGYVVGEFRVNGDGWHRGADRWRDGEHPRCAWCGLV